MDETNRAMIEIQKKIEYRKVYLLLNYINVAYSYVHYALIVNESMKSIYLTNYLSMFMLLYHFKDSLTGFFSFSILNQLNQLICL